MVGDLFINGKDAYTTWGISLDETSLSSLMTPAPNKALVENKSRNNHGKEVDTSNPKKDEKSLTLIINITAQDKDTFFTRFDSFCEELDGGVLNIKTKYQPNKMYRTIYQSCQQFSEFMCGIGKFTLKLVEPNPNNRSL